MMEVKTILADDILKINEQSKITNIFKEIIPYLGLIIVSIIFATTTNGRFIRISNLLLIFKQSVIIMVGALGVTFVMAHGNIDFSLGGELALCSIAGWYASQVSPVLLLPVCILTGILISSVICYSNIKIGLPIFAVGICVMFIGKGIAQAMNSIQMYIPDVYRPLDTPNFYLIVALIVMAIVYILFNYTKIGKYNQIIGVNSRTAKLSGIHEGKSKLLAFIIAGAACGLSAFLTMVRAGAVTATTGATFEMDVLLVMTLGGVPLSGGSGVRLRNGILGSLTYYILKNGLVIWGVPQEWIYIINGLLFLGLVFFSYDRNNGKEIF